MKEPNMVLNCHPRANCVDNGDFINVSVWKGFRGDGVNICEDINECKEKTLLTTGTLQYIMNLFKYSHCKQLSIFFLVLNRIDSLEI